MKNLLFIDNSLKSLDLFLNGCNDNTKCVVYSINNSLQDLNNKIIEFGELSFQHLGFVFENSGLEKLFVENTPFISLGENGDIQENLTTNFIKSLVNVYNIKTVDFLACDLLLNETWKQYFFILETICSDRNLLVRASDDKSGNLKDSGDWILETTNDDVTNLYFNENIGQWSHLLDNYFDNNGLSVILSNETTNNMYASGISDYVNLTPNNYELFTDIPFSANNIVKIIPHNGYLAQTDNNFYIITNETSNNLYATGTYCLGFTSTQYSGFVSYQRITTGILNKKVIDVKVKFPTGSALYVITDEEINNLYTAGDYTIIGNGPSTGTGIRYSLQQVITNSKVIDASIGNSSASIITNESINNLYSTGSNSNGGMGVGSSTTVTRTFQRTNLNKTLIRVYSYNNSTIALTNEGYNNIVVSGSTNAYNNMLSKIYTFSYLQNTINKKIIDIDVLTPSINNPPTAVLLLSDETTNNLYKLGTASYAIDNNNASSYILGNITENILNKRVTNILCNVTSYSILTDETSNNLYACGLSNYGASNMGLYIEERYSNFINVSLSSGNDILINKKFNSLYGYGFGANSTAMDMTLVNDGNNLYRVSGYLNNSKYYFNKLHYPLNKKILDFTLTPYIWIGITNESSNNLYIQRTVSGVYPLSSGLVTYRQFQNLNTVSGHNQILNKRITKVCSSNQYSYVITDETNNNLYGATRIISSSYPIGNTVDGVSTGSVYFTKITEVINDLTITHVSCNNQHVGILTSESSNNFYTLGKMVNTQTTIRITFTKHSPSILLNKKIIKLDCNSENRTFLITDETSNNLYSYGTGVLGNNNINTNPPNSFYKVAYSLLNKKVINVSSSNDGSVGVLTSESFNNFYIAGNSNLSASPNVFTKVSNATINNKRFIDITLGYNFIKLISDEENDNIYLISNNNSKLGNGKEPLTNYVFMKPSLPVPIKATIYVPPVVASNVPVVINTAPITTVDSSNNSVPSIPVRYAPKAVNIGNNNRIFFPDPTKTSINIAPVQTTEAVQKYQSVLNVSAKNQVSGYIKLEPAGTTFEQHISLEFDVEPRIHPVVYFKSSSDPAPLLIPSSNNSSNDVYYTANISTGTVTLYTKHFSEAIVTQDTSQLNPSVNFNLSYLDVAITMSVTGDLLSQDIPSLEGDAIAEYYVSASDMRNVFMFQSDSDDVDTIMNGTDIKYFVRRSLWPSGLVLNPCHAWVQSSQQIATTDRLGSIADNRELVKHDFIRHIAKSLFNTHLAVDLFSNEDTLKYDLAYNGHYTAWNNIWNSISGVSDVSLNTSGYEGLYGQDASYGYYLTGDASANTNICRQLLTQLTKTAPARLQNLNTYVVDASKGYYSVPLIDGDSISFKLVLQPAPNQHLLVNRPSPVPARTYQIRINLRDTVSKGASHADGVNVIVNDTAPLTYGGVAVTDNLNTSYPANY